MANLLAAPATGIQVVQLLGGLILHFVSLLQAVLASCSGRSIVHNFSPDLQHPPTMVLPVWVMTNCVSLMAMFFLMAPKSQQKASAKKETKKGAPEKDESGLKRLAMSNMVTSLKRGTSNEAQSLLKMYQSMGHRDPRKTELLALWSKDKSCKWLNNYCETGTVADSSNQDRFSGYGTKWLTYCNHLAFNLCLLRMGLLRGGSPMSAFAMTALLQV